MTVAEIVVTTLPVRPMTLVISWRAGGGRSGEVPDQGEVRRSALGFALYAGAFGMTFGAVATALGLTVAQTMVLSIVMFTGASQFAFVGVVGAGGSPFAAILPALLLGVRNAFYGVPITAIERPRGLRRFVAAHFVIDETTAMAVAQRDPATRRYAFWLTGVSLFALWNLGSLAGALLGTAVDPQALGLDAAAPAVFLALLWPQLKLPGARLLAIGAVGTAALLIPIAPAGVPVIAAGILAVIVGWRQADTAGIPGAPDGLGVSGVPGVPSGPGTSVPSGPGASGVPSGPGASISPGSPGSAGAPGAPGSPDTSSASGLSGTPTAPMAPGAVGPIDANVAERSERPIDRSAESEPDDASSYDQDDRR